ncbi:MAG: hypothetical protein IKS88_04815 [Clostridia bacterium]|nr:hypothetical protein [Clostridia bacterium]
MLSPSVFAAVSVFTASPSVCSTLSAMPSPCARQRAHAAPASSIAAIRNAAAKIPRFLFV